MRSILTTIALLISVATAVPERKGPNSMPLNCRIRYDIDTQLGWFNLGQGIIYGLYDDPPSRLKCDRCITFGKSLRDLNVFFAKMDSISAIWFDKSAILRMEFFDMFDALLNLYPTFSNYYETLANVFTDEAFVAVWGLQPYEVAGPQVSTISDTLTSLAIDFLRGPVEVAEREKEVSLTQMFFLINSIPGSDCFELGYKGASLLRMALGKTLVHTVSLLDLVPVEDVVNAADSF